MDFDPNFENTLTRVLKSEFEYSNELKAFAQTPGFMKLVPGLSVEKSIPVAAIVPS